MEGVGQNAMFYGNMLHMYVLCMLCVFYGMFCGEFVQVQTSPDL